MGQQAALGQPNTVEAIMTNTITHADIDAAIPVNGEPSRAKTNKLLKDMADSIGNTHTVDYTPTPGTLPVRSEATADFTGGRIKAAPASDPDDVVILAQLNAARGGSASGHIANEGDVVSIDCGSVTYSIRKHEGKLQQFARCNIGGEIEADLFLSCVADTNYFTDTTFERITLGPVDARLAWFGAESFRVSLVVHEGGRTWEVGGFLAQTGVRVALWARQVA